MTYKDLMIGDWVKEIAIDGSILTGSAEIQIDLAGLRLCAEGMVKLEPIPLTEEILKVNGFILQSKANRVHHKMYSMPSDYRHSLEDAEKKGGYYWQSNGALICLLRYVHELQHALRLCGLNELADSFKIEEENDKRRAKDVSEV